MNGFGFKPTKSASQSYTLEGFDGVDLTNHPLCTVKDKSPDMLNMWKRGGCLCKRDGTKEHFHLEGSSPILSIYESLFNNHFIFQHNHKLYAKKVSEESAYSILNGTADTPGFFYTFLSDLYYIDTANFLKITFNSDTQTVHTTTIDYYVPVIYTSACNALIQSKFSGTAYEEYNMLSKVVKVQYTSFSLPMNPTTFPFNLPEECDTTALIKVVQGQDEFINRQGVTTAVSGVKYYSVVSSSVINLWVGKSDGTFDIFVASGMSTNPVYITFTRKNAPEFTANRNIILSCRAAMTYGDDLSARLVLGGTDVHKNRIYISAENDPTYFTASLYNNIGDRNEKITGFGKQHGLLVLFKERSIWRVEFDAEGTSTKIPTSLINPVVGCNIPGSIRTIRNNLIFANTYGGVYTLSDTTLANENTVTPISTTINGDKNRGLFSENDLKNAVSISTNSHYYIFSGGNVYVLDYEQAYEGSMDKNPWFFFDGIDAKSAVCSDEKIFFVLSGSPTIAEFARDLYTDFDAPFEAYWQSCITSLEKSNQKKRIKKLLFTLGVAGTARVKIEYITDQPMQNWIDEKDAKFGSFSWANFDWSRLCYKSPKIVKQFTRYPNLNNIQVLAVKLSDISPLGDLQIYNLSVDYLTN